jgi:uncharacterized membrane protein
MRLIFFSVFIISVTACGNIFHNKHENVTNSDNENANSKPTISFAEVRLKVLDPHCIKCHSNYVDYKSVKKNISQILNSVEQNRMPKNAIPISDDLKELLRAWVAEGTPENLETNTDSPEPTDDGALKPTWDSLKLNIFDPKCLVCHSANGKSPWVDFTNRATMAKTLIKHIDFKNPDDSNLILRLRDTEEPMPPLPPQSTLTQLTEEEVLVVIEWIKAGLP